MKKSITKLFVLFFLFVFLLYYRFFLFGPLIEGKYLFFIFWISFLVLFRISGKVSVILGLFSLFMSSLFLLSNHQGAALRVVIYSYFFLLIGALLEFLSSLQNKGKS